MKTVLMFSSRWFNILNMNTFMESFNIKQITNIITCIIMSECVSSRGQSCSLTSLLWIFMELHMNVWFGVCVDWKMFVSLVVDAVLLLLTLCCCEHDSFMWRLKPAASCHISLKILPFLEYFLLSSLNYYL